MFHKELDKKKMPTYMRLHVLYPDFALNHFLQYFYYWQFFLRRFVYAMMLVGFPQSKYITLSVMTIMHMASMLYVTYTLPFSSRWKNIAVMTSEATLVASHGILFAMIQDTPDTGKTHYSYYALLYFVIIIIGMILLTVLIIVDSLSHLKKIKQLCSEPEDEFVPERIIDDITDSSGISAGSQREVTYGSDKSEPEKEAKFEIYDPVKDKEKYELAKKQEEIEKRKKDGTYRPATPTGVGQTPLASQFGRAPFKDTQHMIGDSSDEEEESEDEQS